MLPDLRNGATVLSVTRVKDGDYVVLAHTDGVQPFVTWLANDDGACMWGHYFDDVEEAKADYLKRSGLV